jgi:putative hydrolase
MFMGMQAGTIIGTIAADITGSHDIGLPAHDDALLIVTPAIDTIAAEASLDRRAVRQWVALRAAAHRMLYEGFPLVRAQFFSSYHDYISSLDVDIAEGLERLRSLDMSDPSRLQEILGEQNLFSPSPSGETAKAAEGVTRLLALIEAHAGIAVEHAGIRAGDTAAIAAVFARRAATATRGTEMLDSFIGLDRTAGRASARAFVEAVVQRSGWTVLNAMWEEPDAVPASDEIENPAAWIGRVSA